MFGATLLPIGNSRKYTAANEATRQAVNTWIRTGGAYDAVFDFEQVVAQPGSNPLRIKPGFSAATAFIPATLATRPWRTRSI